MDEFFSSPPKDPYIGYKAMGEYLVRREAAGQRALEFEARQFEDPLLDMATELERSVFTNVTVRLPDYPDLGEGWTVSKIKMREGERTITLLKDGRLLIGDTLEFDKTTGHRVVMPYCPNLNYEDIDITGLIDLNTYPFHPLFATESGYEDVYATSPDLATQKRATNPTARVKPIDIKTKKPIVKHDSEPVILPDSREAYVASNLEKLKADLYRARVDYLGTP